MTSGGPQPTLQPVGELCSRWREGSTTEGLILEAWGQGLLLGALMIMLCSTVAAMRRGVLLHKLILLEQTLIMPSGTYCFMSFESYGWYVSSTAALLYCSYFVHNIVAWMKIRPFFVSHPSLSTVKHGKLIQRIYWITLALTAPVLIFQITNDFRCNVDMGLLYGLARPYEFIMRDPWWIFTNIALIRVIGQTYGIGVFRLIKISPRLGILLLAVILSISFAILDLLASILKGRMGGVVNGINPYWKLSLVFKCLTDAIMLDDFATELKKISDKTSLGSDLNFGTNDQYDDNKKESDGDRKRPPTQKWETERFDDLESSATNPNALTADSMA